MVRVDAGPATCGGPGVRARGHRHGAEGPEVRRRVRRQRAVRGARRHARVLRGDDLERPSTKRAPGAFPPLLLWGLRRARPVGGLSLGLGNQAPTLPAGPCSETVGSTVGGQNNGAVGSGAARRVLARGASGAADPGVALAGPTRAAGRTPVSGRSRRGRGRVCRRRRGRAVRRPRAAGVSAVRVENVDVPHHGCSPRAPPRANLDAGARRRHLRAVTPWPKSHASAVVSAATGSVPSMRRTPSVPTASPLRFVVGAGR